MGVGDFRDDVTCRLDAIQKQVRELQRNEMMLLLRIMALEKLIGATPAETALLREETDGKL